MKELKRCMFYINIMFFVSMKCLELNCTLPRWLSVHQTDDKSTSIMCRIYISKSRHITSTKSENYVLLWWGDGSYNLWGNTYEVFLDYTQQMLYFISPLLHLCL